MKIEKLKPPIRKHTHEAVSHLKLTSPLKKYVRVLESHLLTAALLFYVGDVSPPKTNERPLKRDYFQ